MRKILKNLILFNVLFISSNAHYKQDQIQDLVEQEVSPFLFYIVRPEQMRQGAEKEFKRKIIQIHELNNIIDGLKKIKQDHLNIIRNSHSPS